jgi:hypothetical protein
MFSSTVHDLRAQVRIRLLCLYFWILASCHDAGEAEAGCRRQGSQNGPGPVSRTKKKQAANRANWVVNRTLRFGLVI